MAKRILTGAFLRTRVGKRIALVFIGCAALPISLMGILSYQRIESQLREQSDERLFHASKINGQALQQRLDLLRSELKQQAQPPELTPDAAWIDAPRRSHFLRFAIAPIDGALVPEGVPSLTDSARAHLRQDKGLLYAGADASQPIRMATLLNDNEGERIAWGEVDPAFLWSEPLGNGADASAPDFCVIAGRTPVYCDLRLAQRIQSMLQNGEALRRIEWEGEFDRYLAAGWPLFMRFNWQQDDWTIVSSESSSLVGQPLESFKQIYALALGVVLAVVALLSQISVRRTLQPLEALSAATARISHRDFSTRVEVTSDDEFGGLARSFNAMAGSLETQFNGLNTIAELSQRLLTARTPQELAQLTLPSALRLVPSKAAAIVLLPANGDANGGSADVWVARPDEPPTMAGPLPVQPGWYAPASSTILSDGANDPRIPRALLGAAASTYVIRPFRAGSAVAGYLVFARTETALTAEQALFAHQLADLLAVAFSAVRLLHELDTLSWGALHALARAIDAKSHWTAGHSDRVTAIAVAIGRELQLPAAEIERIHRGGLLHDIGKIGVSAAVLDKPGSLNDAEWAEMKSHVTLGARILEPIHHYADLIPLVLYHHERYDGRGYPEGLKGTDIPLLARVLAVADVYDALVSDRPYRPGMSEERALSIIEEGSGTHFDPEIASVFLELMRSREGSVIRELYRTASRPAAPIAQG